MARHTDRRNRVALDHVYTYYRCTVVNDGHDDLLSLVNALKTISHALRGYSSPSFKLTRRLWLRIEQALFDRLITSYPAHAVILNANGKALTSHDALTGGCIIELHPEGLRRADDVFRMPYSDLPAATQTQLTRAWKEKGPAIKREDFLSSQCNATGVCAMKPFAVGHELIEEEAASGRLIAYQEWWNLYWQEYCTADGREKRMLSRQMDSLESVWGNLYY
jgi:hypothetical protein